jgi:microcystin-dependent protein
MAKDISSNNQSISSIKALSNVDDSYTVLADRLSSFNFNGNIGKKISQESIADVIAGDIIFASNPSYSDENQYFVTKKEQIVQADDSIRNYIYVLTSENIEEPFTYNATFEDGSYDNATSFYTISDDISTVTLGTDGWLLTRNGNAIFSNVFVRGAIEATSGKFDGVLTAGLDSQDQPLVSIGSNIFQGLDFESRTEEHSGIFLDENNYLLSFDGKSEVAVTRVDVANNTQTDHTTYIELIIGTHLLVAGDFISLDGFDEEIYPTVNGTKVISSVTSTTVSFKIDKDFTGLTNPVTESFLVRSDRIEGILEGTQFNYIQVNSATENTSTIKIYAPSNILDALDPGDYVDLINFTNTDLLSLNTSVSVQSIDSTFFTVFLPRITAGTNITTGLGVISEKTKQSKFKVGNDINNLIFTSETGNLSVTGTVNAKGGNFTETVTIGNGSTQGKLQVGTSTGVNSSWFEIIGTNDKASTVIKTKDAAYGTSGVWLSADGKFSLGNQLTFSDGNLTITGGLTATSLTVGTDPNQIIISNTSVSGNPGIFISGSSDFIRNTGAFRLGGASGISYSGTGNVTIGTGATFAGALSAASGTFSGSLSAASGTFSGDISGASGTFTGSLSGATISGGTISIGSSNNIFKADSNGIYLGNALFGSAPFKVTPAGVLTATGATISGEITATSGSFTGNVKINTGGNLFLGTNIGSGSRIVLSSTNITAYNASGVEAFYLPTNGDRPRLTDFNVLNAKVTGDGPNAYIIAGGIDETSTSVVIRGYNTGTLPAAIYNVNAGTKTLFNSGTGFYMDDDGFFKVGSSTANAKFDPTANSGTGEFSVTGKIFATSGYIGGIDSGWNITSGHIASYAFNPYTLKPVDPITLDSGSLDAVSKIFVGTEGSWNNFNTPFYVDSEGYVSIGKGLQSMTYDPSLDKIIFTGNIQASGGFIGSSQDIGWRFDQNGILVSGYNEKTVALASSGAQFFGGSSQVKVTRILADDEFQEYGGLFGTIYVTLDLSSLSDNGKEAYIPSVNPDGISELESKYIKFSFSNSISSTIRTALNGKELPIISVEERYPFSYGDILVEYNGSGDPTSALNQTVTANSQPTATTDIYPVYVQKENSSTLTLYCNEKLAGFTGYNATYDLAVGQSVTLYTEDLAGFTEGEQSYTIASVSTTPTWYAPDETYYWKIQLSVTGTAFAITDVFTNLYFYKPVPTNHVTVSVYPEDANINIHNVPPPSGPSAEGYTEYSSVSTTCSGTAAGTQITVANPANITVGMSVIADGVNPFATVQAIAGTLITLTKPNLKTMAAETSVTFAQSGVAFYDNYATVSDTGVYYMWAGDDSPGESSFSISRNDTSGKITIKADAGTVPVGTINMWATDTPPPGWKICNGDALLITAYSQLYSVIGTTFNAFGGFTAPAAGNFRVPNYRGLYPLGYRASGSTAAASAYTAVALNASGGNFSLAHTHTFEDTAATVGNSAHTHDVNPGPVTSAAPNVNGVSRGNFTVVSQPSGGTAFAESGHTHSVNVATTESTENTHKHTVSVSGTTGGSSTANYTPPYFGINYIIYTGVI